MTNSGFNTPKINFPGPIGTKRRRMRSGGGNVSTGQNQNNSNQPQQLLLEDLDELSADGKTTQTSNCKGATTIPLFLKSKFLPRNLPRRSQRAVRPLGCLPERVGEPIFCTAPHSIHWFLILETYKMIDSCDPVICSW